MSAAPRRPTAFATCAWCAERKPIAEMRHPNSSRGKTPTTCHACRIAHPELGWCDDHGQTHPIETFPVDRSRPIGRLNICRDAYAYRVAQKRTQPRRTCVSCGDERDSWFFRGGRSKAVACRDCEAAHRGERWCLDCAGWLPLESFYRTGPGGKYMEARCRSCRITNAHGVTRAHMEDLTGSAIPSCGACGSLDALKVDHDHNHCPAQRGCRECVRGYLCHQCNTAEGMLRTAERARLLADYMTRWSVGREVFADSGAVGIRDAS